MNLVLEAGFMAADALSVGIPTAANQKKLRSDAFGALTAVGLCDSELEGTPCCLPFFMPTSCSSTFFRLVIHELPTSI